MKAEFKSASPYKEDTMNLPVKDVETATTFYEMLWVFKLYREKMISQN